jgi:putative membrane protein
MVRMLISTGVHLLANAVGLLVAAVVLDDMTVSGVAFVIAVVLFTAVEVLVQPLFTKMAMKNVPALQGGTALVATFVGLVVTSIVSDGLEISGATTWVLATLIVWIASLLAAVILPLFLVKKAVSEKSS